MVTKAGQKIDDTTIVIGTSAQRQLGVLAMQGAEFGRAGDLGNFIDGTDANLV